MWRFLGLSPATEDAKPEPCRSLPASWYRSPELYQLERRAVISRKWILVTHTLRFKQAGDYVSFNYADFSFFLVQDRDGNINSFHNICRHRAYPVVENRYGKASILSCKYHGWSYGFKGNLAKAPRFDTVRGFDKSQHGLLPVHVRIDPAGFVWVNLEAGEPDVKWEDDFGGVYEKPRMQNFDFAGGYKYDHVWQMELDANWKAVIENYNECLHCAFSHPLIAGVSDLARYTVKPSGGCLEHEIVNKKSQEEEDEFRRSITFFFPSTSVTITQNFFYIQRMIPVSETRTRIENEVYRHHSATDEDFDAINAFYKQVLEEDKQLCVGAQGNLSTGVFINGELHPEKEKASNHLLGPIHFQNTVREEVMQHRKKELGQGGREIWPATPKLYGEMKTGKLSEEEAFCSELDKASCGGRQELAW
ncbi:Carnitine monooxygenase oxygenase subunit [Colletotrichum trifolii]|uniref:Choline monooxygenase, chloroplastic n=1 Tax=Colletotrichum trifolii TaxID=5466 RepID=A0A4V3HX31_COLTR|nr:Carnitine monooxygenase oxygenase subunit [Colletotrichum trifolii]